MGYRQMVWLIVAGLVAGVLGGMGMGGGTVYIPILTQGLSVPQHLAQWLNLVAFVPMAAASLAVHAKHKLLDKKGFRTLLAPSLASAVGFSLLAVKLSAAVLGVIFAFFLVAMGLAGLVVTVAGLVKKRLNDKPHEPKDL